MESSLLPLPPTPFLFELPTAGALGSEATDLEAVSITAKKRKITRAHAIMLMLWDCLSVDQRSSVNSCGSPRHIPAALGRKSFGKAKCLLVVY
jgi:hypothetical protein